MTKCEDFETECEDRFSMCVLLSQRPIVKFDYVRKKYFWCEDFKTECEDRFSIGLLLHRRPISKLAECEDFL
jgi:hypothetical protein